MPVYKHKTRKSWYTSFYYINWQGEHCRKKKEGFISKKDAIDYEREFLLKMSGQCNMSFTSFVQLYLEDCKKRVKSSTYTTKEVIIRKYLLPYFYNISVNEITPMTVRRWQTQMLNKKEKYSMQYLRYINTQLACIFNFAGKYYNLRENPMHQCEAMGKSESKKLSFWTLKEFNTVLKLINKNEPCYTAFHLLFWTGIRRGELLALRPIDFDFKNKNLTVQRNLILIANKEYLGTPKTECSNRIISIPDFLIRMVKYYINIKNIKKEERLFEKHPVYFARCIEKYSKKAKINAIRIHDFRHSHASLLIEEGVSPLIIAERLGHKNANITLKIYSHLYPNKQLKLAEKLDKLHKNNF